LSYNKESKIVQILKTVVQFHTNYILNIGKENFQKFEMGGAGVMSVA